MRAFRIGRPSPLSSLSLLAALLLLLGIGVALPLEGALRRSLSAELRSLEARFEASSGLRLRYESLSPSILAGLEFRDLVIEGLDGASFLRARRLSLRFNLSSLLSAGRSPLISSVLVEGARASLGKADSDRLLAYLRRPEEGGGTKGLPALRVFVRDLKLELPELGGLGISLSARRFDLDTGGSLPSLSFDGSVEGGIPGLGGLSAVLGLSGSFSPSLDAGRFRVEVGAKTKDFTLKRQSFDLSLAEGILELRKTRSSSPIDLYGRYDLRQGLATLSLRTEQLRPDSLFVPAGRLSSLAPWFREDWSGDFRLSLRPGDGAILSYQGSLRGPLPPSLGLGPWALELAARGEGSAIEVQEARATGPRGSLSLRGRAELSRRLLDLGLDIDGSFLPQGLPVKASLALKGESGSYRLEGRDLSIGGLGFGAAALDLRLDPSSPSGSFSLSLGLPAAEAGSGFAPGSPSSLRAEGSFLAGKEPLLELALGLEGLDGEALRPLLARFLPERSLALLSSLDLGGSLVLHSDLSHLSWSTSDLRLRSRSLPGLEALVAASGSDLDFRLRSATLSYQGREALLSGELSLASPEMLSFSATLQYAGIPYGLHGTWVRDSLNLRGDYALALDCRFSEDLVVASLSFASLPLPVDGFPLSLTGDADVSYRSPADWRLALGQLSVLSSSFGGAVPGFTCAGLFGPQGGRISSAKLSDRVSTVEGSGSLGWGGGGARLELKLGAAPAEHYDLSARLEGPSLSASLAFGASPLSRFVQQRLAGELEGSLGLKGTLASPSLGYDLSLKDGKFDDFPLQLRLRGGLDASGLGVGDGLLSWQGFTLSALKAGFDPGTGSGSVSGRFDSSQVLKGGGFDFEAAIQSRVAKPANPLAALADCRITGATRDFSYATLRSALWPFVADLSPRGLFLNGGPGDDLVLSLPSDGSFALKAKAPFPVLVDLQGRIRGENVEAAAHGLSIDMPILAALVGDLPVHFKGGKLEGDLLASGPLADPEFSGALRLSDCELSIPGWISETAGPLSAPVVVDGKRLLLQAPSVPILSSRFSFAFELDFEGWLPTGMHLALGSLPGTRVPLETNILGVAIKGFGVPDIRLDIQGPVLSVKGNLVLEDTDVTVTPQTLSQGEASDEPPANLLDIDLGITTARGVHFYFPNRDYPVIAGNVVPGNRLTVRYDQARDELAFKGEIDARGGDAFYIQRNFFLRSAKIVFNESSGKDFDPLVSMLAELHDSTAEGPITVTLRADSQPISTFKPSITSDPPKSEADIALILGQGLLAIDETGSTSLGRLAVASTEFVPQLNVTKAFESRVRDALNLDVLYFNSQVLQRWIFSMAGGGTQSPPSLSDYLKETNLFAGKYLSDSVFLHGALRLDADPLVPSGSLGIVSELGVDFETPFGLLQWTVQPQHPQQLFVDDQSLSLSWRLPLK